MIGAIGHIGQMLGRQGASAPPTGGGNTPSTALTSAINGAALYSAINGQILTKAVGS